MTWDSSKGESYGKQKDYEREKKKMKQEIREKSRRIWKNLQ